jgi:hypothetical protein
MRSIGYLLIASLEHFPYSNLLLEWVVGFLERDLKVCFILPEFVFIMHAQHCLMCIVSRLLSVLQAIK